MTEREYNHEREKLEDKWHDWVDCHRCNMCIDFKHNDEVEGFDGYCVRDKCSCNSIDFNKECWED